MIWTKLNKKLIRKKANALPLKITNEFKYIVPRRGHGRMRCAGGCVAVAVAVAVAVSRGRARSACALRRARRGRTK